MSKQINPKWISAAVVHNADGSRFGTVTRVFSSHIEVAAKGVVHTMNAQELDKAGRISKPHSKHTKYL